MSRQKNSQAKKVKMLRLVKEQEQSGQSQIEFCKEQKLSIATFGYWRKKYLLEKANRKTTSFVPLTIKPVEQQDTSIEVELPNQILLRSTAWQTENLTSLIIKLYPIKSYKN